MSDNLDHLLDTLPDQKNFEVSYGLAYSLAVKKLISVTHFDELCHRSGSALIVENGENFLQLSYLNNTFRINLKDAEIGIIGETSPIALRDKILVLHYLLTASGISLSNKFISFKDLGEGLPYYPTFYQRVIQPLITYFGKHPDKILECARPVGGIKSTYGDFSVTISAFIRVPVTLVLWRGDDEFPANANILFDSTVLDYLPLEDLIVLCQTIVWKMIKSL